MSSRSFRTIAIAAVGAASLPFSQLAAAELPAIKLSDSNKVPECATPGRMMSFIKSRNPNLDPKFEKIAVHYMRQGEELGVRWDYAIAQMAIETNYLSYRAAGGRKSDVSPSQNNFAGIGATGRGEPGESFKDVTTGVRAHLQHLMLYAGDDVSDAVAERTRKVKEWGVLKSFHARIKGPVTFRDLARKWAVSADYGNAIETHAKLFYSTHCNQPDPAPELVAEARGVKPTPKVAAAEPKLEVMQEKVSGAELAKRAIEEARAEGDDRRRGLGAGRLSKPVAPAPSEDAQKATPAPQMTVLNAPKPEVEAKPEIKVETPKVERAPKAEKPSIAEKIEKAEKPQAEKPAQVMTASAGGAAARSIPPAVAGSKCRVWTASYGGQRAIIIRSQSDGAVNFTVLDVNEGAEKREADAYISAYAKGGVVAHEFASQTQALDKAFELCPEG